MLPTTPDAHAIASLVLTVIALFLFTRDRIPLETSSLIILVTLVLLFHIFPYTNNSEVPVKPADFFTGFGHEALIAICALMIIAQGIETTGALTPMATYMAEHWQERPALSLLATLVITAVLSAFLNNTPIVLLMLPMMITVALRTGIAASSMMMPMGFATLIGGMSTTIGTSTNLLVVAIAADSGLPRFSMFDFTLPVFLAGGAGILYLWLIAPKLVPEREVLLKDTSQRIFDAALHVVEEGFANGKTLAEVLAKTGNRMRVERIRRGESLSLTRLPSVVLKTGDRIYVSDTRDNLTEYQTLLGAKLHNVTDETHPVSEERPLSPGGQQMAEVVVTAGSILQNWTIRKSRFAERYQCIILAIHRAKKSAAEPVSELLDTRLQEGDVLLIQGKRECVDDLKRRGHMLVLDGTTDLPYTDRSTTALIIISAVVLAAATGLMPISISSLCGVLAMLITRTLSWRDTSEALSVPVIMIVVTSLALGTALMETGGITFVAQLFVAVTSQLPAEGVLAGLILLMAVVTNVVSNNAAAVIGTPVAISVAQQLNVPVEPFVLAVLVGANMSYCTPVGYQTNLLIFSAGGYKFTDFVRVGVPLTIIMWIAFSLILPWYYGM